MEISIGITTLFLAILLTGLSAGLFYAWEVSVIPGTKILKDLTYLETMQSINRAILNPGFFLIFFGSPVLLISSAIQQYHSTAVFWILVASFLFYLFGTFGVTLFGNVPLNNLLDAIDLNDKSIDQLQNLRNDYESKWNRLHKLRTGFALISFLCSLIAAFRHSIIT